MQQEAQQFMQEGTKRPANLLCPACTSLGMVVTRHRTRAQWKEQWQLFAVRLLYPDGEPSCLSIGPHKIQSSLGYIEWSWWLGEALEDWKRANITSVFIKEGARNYKSIGFNPWQCQRRNLPENRFQTRVGQKGEWICVVCMDLCKENFAWPNTLLSTMMWLARWMRGEQWMPTSALAKPLTLSPIIFIDKLTKYRLDEWMVRWIENHLKNKVQKFFIWGTMSNWRRVISSVPH